LQEGLGYNYCRDVYLFTASVSERATVLTAMARVTFDIDLPRDITITSYERHGAGHGLEVSWPLPQRCRCDCCRREDQAHLEFPNRVQVVRDLDICGQPSFWVYQPAFHRCPWCHHRQWLIPSFKRKDTSYTYRFEQYVLRLLIGSNEEEVARRLGISAETVALIVRNQLTDTKDKDIDPRRVLSDVGIDEISLKKRHKLYATILTDLTNPERPEVLAVASGRDETAGQKCLEKLTLQQRQGVRTYRADMAQAFHNACRQLLLHAKPVVDRFHVAKKFNEAIDGQRKKRTQAYKAKLTKAERKEFRSLMWQFRRNPQDLTLEERQSLEGLFDKLPQLRTLHEFRVQFQKIFDTPWDRQKAHRALLLLFLDMMDFSPELNGIIRTFETWQEEILNYFDARQTSGPVEGLNNKARVILKRSYGLKGADSLWTRLILDVNRARDVVLYTIDEIKELVVGFRTRFACT
jgi:transposase